MRSGAKIAVFTVAFFLPGCPERPSAPVASGSGEAHSTKSSEATPVFGQEAPGEAREKKETQESSATLVGARQRLRATHELGVPLHTRPHLTSVSGRLPDGSEVTVVAQAEDDPNWLLIETSGADGKQGWIVRRYLASWRGPSLTSATLSQESPFFSLETCKRRLAARPAREQRDDLVVATWNVRWFPDGQPGNKAAPAGTDLSWLACSLAWLDADVVALQEFKTLPRARTALQKVLDEVERLGGRRYRAFLDDCPQGATQHVGFLLDRAREHTAGPRTEPSINPHGNACQDSLRPGFSVRVQRPGGGWLRLTSVHLKSGTGRRSLDLRRQSWTALAALATDSPDPVVYVGDFNTMGCSQCSPPVTASQERQELAERLATADVVPLAVEPPCSHYYRGSPGLLDGYWLSTNAQPSGSARASGLCGALSCRPARVNRLPFFERVSDHCPLVASWSDGPD